MRFLGGGVASHLLARCLLIRKWSPITVRYKCCIPGVGTVLHPSDLVRDQIHAVQPNELATWQRVYRAHRDHDWENISEKHLFEYTGVPAVKVCAHTKLPWSVGTLCGTARIR